LLSASWEIIEHVVFKSEKMFFGGENKCTGVFCGRFEDIVINIVGYMIGSTIANCQGLKSVNVKRHRGRFIKTKKINKYH
jgi:hypothetical protein